jgi:chromosome segregation ATPase
VDNEGTMASLKGPGLPSDEPSEVDRLRAENEELHSIVAELRQLIDEASAGMANAALFADREKEFERMLEEKSELIREMAARVQELEKAASVPRPPNEKELLTMSDELERERAQMEQERRQLDEQLRQLKEDEGSMMEQMREMEVQMARERAEMARQRNELQRLHSDIRHELEVASRDEELKRRLGMLVRKHQEVVNRGRDTAPAPPPPPAAPSPSMPTPAPRSKDSGLLRRLFGQG